MQIKKKKNLLLNASPCVLQPAWHTCFTVFNPWQLVVTPGRLWLKTTFQATHRSCTEPSWLSLWRLKAPISTSRQFKAWKKIVQMGQSSQLKKKNISLLCLFWCFGIFLNGEILQIKRRSLNQLSSGVKEEANENKICHSRPQHTTMLLAWPFLIFFDKLLKSISINWEYDFDSYFYLLGNDTM